jgi:phosphatidylinositol alpha 1,6-mannosyltransferase
MRVAHFLGTMRPEHDGVTRVMYQMRGEFRRSDGEHRFITPILPEVLPEDMRGVRSVPLPFSTGYRLSTCGRKGLAKVLGDAPDLAHIHTPCTLGLVAAKYAKAKGIPIVFTYHTHFPSYLKYYHVEFLKPLVWKYLRFLYRHADATVVPSQSVLTELREQGFPNLVHIPHGVDTSRFSPEYRNAEWRKSVGGDKKTLVTFVGRLVWEKNLASVAAAAERVKDNNVQFVVVGEGPARAALQEMMPRAHFTGFLTGEALSVAYASSDVFLFPSATETFGNVTVEALASGLPAVCADIGGATGIVEPWKNGFLVKPDDAQALGEAIETLTRDSGLRRRMSENAFASSKNYSWKATVRRYQALYGNVLERQDAGARDTLNGLPLPTDPAAMAIEPS